MDPSTSQVAWLAALTALLALVLAIAFNQSSVGTIEKLTKRVAYLEHHDTLVCHPIEGSTTGARVCVTP